MPTKPSDQPLVWASSAVYATGPFIGQPGKVVPSGSVAAEGHRPGALYPTPAEYENSQQNRITLLCQWLFAGSYAGAANAHVVETDATGRTQLQGLTLVDAADEVVFSVTGVNTMAPTALFSCTTGAVIVQSDIGNSTGTCFNAVVGSGAGVGLAVSMTGTNTAGQGIQVLTDVTSDGDCIVVTQNGDGYGVDVHGGPTVQAMRVTAGSGQIAGDFSTSTGVAAVTAGGGTTASVWAIGSGNGFGGRFDGGSTATCGLQGSGASTTAYGVHGRTKSNAGSSAAGVFAEGRGTGAIGCYARSDDGIGLIAQSDGSSPGYPAVRIVPQDDDPSSYTSDGAFIWRSGDGLKQPRHCVAGYGYKSLLSYGLGGALHAVNAFAVGDTQTDNSGVLTSALTVECQDSDGNGYFGADIGSTVYIKVSCDVRTNGSPDYLQMEIQDATNGGSTIASWSGSGSGAQAAFYCGDSVSDWQRSVCVVVPYVPPTDGDLTVEVFIARLTNTITIRNLRAEVTGTF